MQQRIGPESPGLSRFFAARITLVLVAAFYVAGLVFVFLYSLGYDPLSHHLALDWPFTWPASWWGG